MSTSHSKTWIPIPSFLSNPDQRDRFRVDCKYPYENIPFTQSMISNMTATEYKKYVVSYLQVDADALVSGVQDEIKELEEELQQSISRNRERRATIEELTETLQETTQKLQTTRAALAEVSKILSKLQT